MLVDVLLGKRRDCGHGSRHRLDHWHERKKLWLVGVLPELLPRPRHDGVLNATSVVRVVGKHDGLVCVRGRRWCEQQLGVASWGACASAHLVGDLEQGSGDGASAECECGSDKHVFAIDGRHSKLGVLATSDPDGTRRKVAQLEGREPQLQGSGHTYSLLGYGIEV